jgi:hypothetical protein
LWNWANPVAAGQAKLQGFLDYSLFDESHTRFFGLISRHPCWIGKARPKLRMFSWLLVKR